MPALYSHENKAVPDFLRGEGLDASLDEAVLCYNRNDDICAGLFKLLTFDWSRRFLLMNVCFTFERVHVLIRMRLWICRGTRLSSGSSTLLFCLCFSLGYFLGPAISLLGISSFGRPCAFNLECSTARS